MLTNIVNFRSKIYNFCSGSQFDDLQWKVTKTAFRVLVGKSAKTISIPKMNNAFVKICVVQFDSI